MNDRSWKPPRYQPNMCNNNEETNKLIVHYNQMTPVQRSSWVQNESEFPDRKLNIQWEENVEDAHKSDNRKRSLAIRVVVVFAIVTVTTMLALYGYSTYYNSLASEMTDVKQSLSDIEQRLKYIDTNLQTHKANLIQLEDDKKTAAEKMEKLEKDVNDTKLKLDDLEIKVKEMQKLNQEQFREVADNLTSNKQRLDELKSEVKEMKKTNQEQLRQLAYNLTANEQRLDNLKTEMKEMKKTNDAQLRQISNQQTANEQRLGNIEDTITQYSRKLYLDNQTLKSQAVKLNLLPWSLIISTILILLYIVI